MSIGRYARAVTGRLHARRHGVSGRMASGSVVTGGRGLRVGRRFFASGPVWIEAITEYGGQTFHPSVTIGDDVRTSPRLHISSIDSITIGDWCLFGENVFIADHQHGATSGDDQPSPDIPPALRPLGGARPIVIGTRCHLGNNVVVLPGANIGEGSIVGANSIVSGVIPPQSMVVGAPARVVKTWDAATQRWERARP